MSDIDVNVNAVETAVEALEKLTHINSQTAVDFNSIRLDATEDINDLWDNEQSFAWNLTQIFDSSVVIPDRDIQLPIFLAYASVPTALSNVIPILLLQGKEGSGKSLATILLSGVFRQEILSSATTFAALRNHTQKSRWQVPDKQEGEMNYAVLFDNVNASTLLNENMYTFFLNGYNRKTDSIQISKGDGSNLEFKVFGAKVCSTIHPLYANPRLAELVRRMLVLKFKRFEEMDEKEIGEFDVNSRLEIESLNLQLLNVKFWEMWNRENSVYFGELKRQLTARKKSFKIPKTIKSTQWVLCPDLIAAGIVSGVWLDIPDAVASFATYWDWYADNIASAVSSLQKACVSYLLEQVTRLESVQRQLGVDIPIEVPCEGLKVHLDVLSRAGALEVHPTPQNVTLVMTALGWVREIGSQGQWTWIKTK